MLKAQEPVYLQSGYLNLREIQLSSSRWASEHPTADVALQSWGSTARTLLKKINKMKMNNKKTSSFFLGNKQVFAS